MMILDSFWQFANRVMGAAGSLNPVDRVKLRRLFERERTRNIVLAKGLLTSLNAKNPDRKDIVRLADLLDSAEKRTVKNQGPFTKGEKEEIAAMFRKYGLPPKLSRWLAAQRDNFLLEQISSMANQSIGRKRIALPEKAEEEAVMRKTKRRAS